jgi:cyclophilin family peptidyl-prolyl cis-trans isomerase/protein-disulfide isomerase
LGRFTGIDAGNAYILKGDVFLVKSIRSPFMGKMMKKGSILFLLLFIIILSACSASDTGLTAGETVTPLLAADPLQVAAQCTAQSAESVDYAQPGDWIAGAVEGYAVTMVEYSDFQCPSCAGFQPVLDAILKEFPGDIRFIYRHFSVGTFDKSNLAAQAAEAAGLQGEFWGMHGTLFNKQEVWADLPIEDFEVWLVGEALTLGLDPERFAEDLNSSEVVDWVAQAQADALDLGLTNTPTIMFDGQQLPIFFQTFDDIVIWLKYQMIPLGRLNEKKFSRCPEMAIDPEKQYTATLHTEKGDIVVALYPDVAPFAVNNFIFLAEKGFYDDNTFHRVVAGQIAQSGDPSGTSMGNPGYFFSIEISPDLLFDRPGLLAMANFDPYSNGSQFFISMIANQDWDGHYTIFGEVIEGMDVVENLTPRNPAADLYTPGDALYEITIEEK